MAFWTYVKILQHVPDCFFCNKPDTPPVLIIISHGHCFKLIWGNFVSNQV